MARQIAHLRALQAFEATARHASFVSAAAELNVTPAAVGQQVRALEAWLGLPLFKRIDSGSQRLVLTDGAQSAMADLKEGFDRLDTALRRLRERRSSKLLTVSVSQAVAARWLLPRLEFFTAANPEVDIRLDISDRVADLAQHEADVGLRCGAGHWPGLVVNKLRDEEMFPVCSPTLAKALPRLDSPADLAHRVLIHDASVHTNGVFPSWSSWLAKAGVDARWAQRGLKINSAGAVVQAAVNGQGVALARRLLSQDDLDCGRLVRLFPADQWPVSWSYFAVHKVDVGASSPAKAFVEWLTATVRSRQEVD